MDMYHDGDIDLSAFGRENLEDKFTDDLKHVVDGEELEQQEPVQAAGANITMYLPSRADLASSTHSSEGYMPPIRRTMDHISLISLIVVTDFKNNFQMCQKISVSD
ncbi:Uncharacterized protein Fot_40049 [Forsythia ovata]|uniref:Uncharacterized protein n=1 Tax=Forsythia ovata TaxID=205694 RepID=A0ABD1S6D7_9LAMI